MAKMPKQVIEKFNNPNTVKFLATVDDGGKPNVAYIGSLRVADEETLIYADTMGVKKNIKPGRPVAVNVLLQEKLISYQVKGTFLEFQTSGDYLDFFNQLPEFKYQPYYGVQAVGVIHVDEVYLASGPLPGRRIVPPEPYLNPMEE
jgi:predicted pyridoxine 5'-phosphate oxidase superfamily flavin-nucleotide-binding protein